MNTRTTTEARHSSESAEHYTPGAIVDAARSLLGGIDLDPASCEAANRVVQAARWMGVEQNGFVQKWRGRVWLNPPGGHCDTTGRQVIKKSAKGPACSATGACGLPLGHVHDACLSAQKAWWFKLADAYQRGHVTAAVFMCFSVELLQTTQVDPPANLTTPLHHPICFPTRRVAYVGEDGEVGGSPPHSSCVIYLPPREHDERRALAELRQHFSWLGMCR